jgi:GT2 family glycosyltransferase
LLSKKIKLSIIILFYHGEQWIETCIRSLENQSLARDMYEIILVDNGGSTPSVANYVGQPYTKVLHLDRNYGFAGGNNRALKNTEGELILLINQDAIIHFNCLAELITSFEQTPQAGIISANMLMISSHDHVNRHATTPKSVGLYRLSPLGYASYTEQQPDIDMVPVEFISGNGMCFRRCILNDVGGYLFDNGLKSYAEDLDLSIRLKKTKWEMYVRPRAVVYHYRDEAFSGKPLEQLRKLINISSNRLLVYYNNFSLGTFLLKLPALLLGIPSKVARPDGSGKIHFLNFQVAFLFIPFIFVYFCFRLLQLSKSPKASLS